MAFCQEDEACSMDSGRGRPGRREGDASLVGGAMPGSGRLRKHEVLSQLANFSRQGSHGGSTAAAEAEATFLSGLVADAEAMVRSRDAGAPHFLEMLMEALLTGRGKRVRDMATLGRLMREALDLGLPVRSGNVAVGVEGRSGADGGYETLAWKLSVILQRVAELKWGGVKDIFEAELACWRRHWECQAAGGEVGRGFGATLGESMHSCIDGEVLFCMGHQEVVEHIAMACTVSERLPGGATLWLLKLLDSMQMSDRGARWQTREAGGLETLALCDAAAVQVLASILQGVKAPSVISSTVNISSVWCSRMLRQSGMEADSLEGEEEEEDEDDDDDDVEDNDTEEEEEEGEEEEEEEEENGEIVGERGESVLGSVGRPARLFSTVGVVQAMGGSYGPPPSLREVTEWVTAEAIFTEPIQKRRAEMIDRVYDVSINRGLLAVWMAMELGVLRSLRPTVAVQLAKDMRAIGFKEAAFRAGLAAIALGATGKQSFCRVAEQLFQPGVKPLSQRASLLVDVISEAIRRQSRIERALRVKPNFFSQIWPLAERLSIAGAAEAAGRLAWLVFHERLSKRRRRAYAPRLIMQPSISRCGDLIVEGWLSGKQDEAEIMSKLKRLLAAPNVNREWVARLGERFTSLGFLSLARELALQSIQYGGWDFFKCPGWRLFVTTEQFKRYDPAFDWAAAFLLETHCYAGRALVDLLTSRPINAETRMCVIFCLALRVTAAINDNSACRSSSPASEETISSPANLLASPFFDIIDSASATTSRGVRLRGEIRLRESSCSELTPKASPLSKLDPERASEAATVLLAHVYNMEEMEGDHLLWALEVWLDLGPAASVKLQTVARGLETSERALALAEVAYSCWPAVARAAWLRGLSLLFQAAMDARELVVQDQRIREAVAALRRKMDRGCPRRPGYRQLDEDCRPGCLECPLYAKAIQEGVVMAQQAAEAIGRPSIDRIITSCMILIGQRKRKASFDPLPYPSRTLLFHMQGSPIVMPHLMAPANLALPQMGSPFNMMVAQMSVPSSAVGSLLLGAPGTMAAPQLALPQPGGLPHWGNQLNMGTHQLGVPLPMAERQVSLMHTTGTQQQVHQAALIYSYFYHGPYGYYAGGGPSFL